MADSRSRGEQLSELAEIMQKLLSPQGCPWDREQSPQSLRPYVIEEAYEVVDAIEQENDANLCEELGDLLLQIVFLSALAERKGAFNLDDVVQGIVAKMVRRHPHVFGDEQAASSAEVLRRWEQIKAEEKGTGDADRGPLAGIPLALPSLQKAQKALRRLAKNSTELKAPATRLCSGDRDVLDAETLGTCLLRLCAQANALHIDAESTLREALRRLGEDGYSV